MKNIKFLTVLICILSIAQFSSAQNALNNGRLSTEKPVDTQAENAPAAKNGDVAQPGVFPIDFDYNNPSAQASHEDQSDNTYPLELDIIRGEIQASTNPAVIAQKVNDLNAMIGDLRKLTEELRLENKIIRESLSNCCSRAELGLTASDAYLLQNAPNPFNGSAQIDYYVPDGLANVELQICDFKGAVLKTFPIEETGYAKLNVNGEGLDQGSFVYMILVNGVVIDSKVMMITK